MAKSHNKKPAIRRRVVNGILVLDKPLDVSSNGALQRAKYLYRAKKAGHTGSLDPLATGVLPLCLGEATKFSQYLLDADKKYLADIKFGVTTTTGDAEGEVIDIKEIGEITETQLKSVFAEFHGEVEQIPSMYSAIKVDGQPLYKLARQGIEIERKSRTIEIFSLELVKFDGETVTVEVHCSKGTYIRTLAEDIGKVLGCGAHVTGLRRTASGPFKLDQAITMSELEDCLENSGEQGLDDLLLSLSEALPHWPKVELTEIGASYFRQGQPVQIAKAPTEGWVRIFSESQDPVFIGVGEIMEDGRIAPRRLVAH